MTRALCAIRASLVRAWTSTRHTSTSSCATGVGTAATGARTGDALAADRLRHRRCAGLLDDVRQFVRQQSPSVGRRGGPAAGRERDVGAEGVRLGADPVRGLAGGGAVVQPHREKSAPNAPSIRSRSAGSSSLPAEPRAPLRPPDVAVIPWPLPARGSRPPPRGASRSTRSAIPSACRSAGSSSAPAGPVNACAEAASRSSSWFPAPAAGAGGSPPGTGPGRPRRIGVLAGALGAARPSHLSALPDQVQVLAELGGRRQLALPGPLPAEGAHEVRHPDRRLLMGSEQRRAERDVADLTAGEGEPLRQPRRGRRRRRSGRRRDRLAPQRQPGVVVRQRELDLAACSRRLNASSRFGAQVRRQDRGRRRSCSIRCSR